MHRKLLIKKLQESHNNPSEAFADIFRNPIMIPIKNDRKILIQKVRMIDDRKKMAR